MWALKTDWNDEAQMAVYYKGFKEIVKNDIAKQERPENLEEMFLLAIRIDQRLYKRRLERKGEYYGGHARKPKDYYGPRPMELDAMYKFRKQVRSAKDTR